VSRVLDLFAGLLILAVVGEETAAQSAPQVRDSAGVRIVTQRAGPVVPLVTTHARFTVDGTEGGREPFHRISGVVLLRNGFVVGNAGTHELRFYDAAGALRTTAGRQGSGPGEFQLMSWIQSYRGDSLVTYDARQRRLAVWSASGKHARDIPVVLQRPAATGPGVFVIAPSPIGLLSGDQLIYVGSVTMVPAPTIQRVPGALMRLNPTTQRHDSIARVEVFDMQIAGGGGGPPMRDVAFPRKFTAAFGASDYFISEGVEYRIDRYSSDGRLISSIRVQRAAAPVTRRDRDEYLSEIDAEERTNVVFGQRLPAYDGLWYDRQGRLWAEHFRAPTVTARQWDVFDAQGRLIAILSAPASLSLVAADATQVYAIHTDDLEVPTLQAFDLPAILKR